MGQLFWLDMDEAQINSNPTTMNAAPWAKLILKAMHTHGMYVNDNGGRGAAYFQLQTEAQAQYTSLKAGDPWLDFAKANWIRSSTDPAYFAQLQGPQPSNPQDRSKWINDWQAIWRHLHVVDPCTIPRPTPCIT
jgi:hypothetical protein